MVYIKAMSEYYDINDLSKLTAISVRTLRYWVAEGVLPPPAGRGPAATYGPGHRDRITLIRRLQDAHLPLAAIRTQLEAMDDQSIAAALAERLAPPKPASAADYVRQVLAKTARQPPPPASPGDAVAPAARYKARSTWERITLHPDIELQVRRPLARADQRRLDALLEAAQRLFPGDD
jgi:DNA-binding transcriptional MerR regulator